MLPNTEFQEHIWGQSVLLNNLRWFFFLSISPESGFGEWGRSWSCPSWSSLESTGSLETLNMALEQTMKKEMWKPRAFWSKGTLQLSCLSAAWWQRPATTQRPSESLPHSPCIPLDCGWKLAKSHSLLLNDHPLVRRGRVFSLQSRLETISKWKTEEALAAFSVQKQLLNGIQMFSESDVPFYLNYILFLCHGDMLYST